MTAPNVGMWGGGQGEWGREFRSRCETGVQVKGNMGHKQIAQDQGSAMQTFPLAPRLGPQLRPARGRDWTHPAQAGGAGRNRQAAAASPPPPPPPMAHLHNNPGVVAVLRPVRCCHTLPHPPSGSTALLGVRLLVKRGVPGTTGHVGLHVHGSSAGGQAFRRSGNCPPGNLLSKAQTLLQAGAGRRSR